MTNEEILETIFQLVAAAAAAEVEIFICIWCVCWVRVCLASWLAEELLTSPLLETDAEPRQNNFQLNSDKVL